jgi:hypothetical protein
MYNIIPKYHLPITDQTLPTLLNDLEERIAGIDARGDGRVGRTPGSRYQPRPLPQCYTTCWLRRRHEASFTAPDKTASHPAENPVRLEIWQRRFILLRRSDEVRGGRSPSVDFRRQACHGVMATGRTRAPEELCNFRKGGANLPVCRDARQGVAHLFGNYFWQSIYTSFPARFMVESCS